MWSQRTVAFTIKLVVGLNSTKLQVDYSYRRATVPAQTTTCQALRRNRVSGFRRHFATSHTLPLDTSRWAPHRRRMRGGWELQWRRRRRRWQEWRGWLRWRHLLQSSCARDAICSRTLRTTKNINTKTLVHNNSWCVLIAFKRGYSLRTYCYTFRPNQIGIPMIMTGKATPAIRAIPTGAPMRVPNCHKIFFLRLHGFLPQNVQPDGLKNNKQNMRDVNEASTKHETNDISSSNSNEAHFDNSIHYRHYYNALRLQMGNRKIKEQHVCGFSQEIIISLGCWETIAK